MNALTDKHLAALESSGMFDADWYQARHPDVDMTGLDPATHYLRYGHRMNRDPGPEFSIRFVRTAYGMKEEHEPLARLDWLRRQAKGKSVEPNPKRVLMAANGVAMAGDHVRAIDLAEAHLPVELGYTAEILRANAALARADEVGWQRHLNAYLARFGAAPIQLEGDGVVFERLASAPLPPLTGGPLISVIMPAWNAEQTVEKAAQSILNQTWRNLELLIIDDASTDDTWLVMQRLAAGDARVKIARNKVNVGPYVSKNIALTQAKGAWITGHDADDWALPQRLEQHLGAILAQPRPALASVIHMLRITPDGNFGHLGQVGAFNIDGAARKASISCLYDRDFLVKRLGFWDCVRFGGDSELIARAGVAECCDFRELPLIGMICQELPTSLTNHPIYGVDKQTGAMLPRRAYSQAWKKWHTTLSPSDLRLDFPPLGPRRFPAPQEALIEPARIRINLGSLKFDTCMPARLDVAIVTDLSLPGGNASSTIEEIEFFLGQGLSVRLIDCRCDRNRKAPTSPRYDRYRSIILSICDACPIRAEVIILRHPSCVTAQQLTFPGASLMCRSAFFVINNSRFRADGSVAYDVAELGRRIRAFSAGQSALCPISDLIRSELLASGDVDGIEFSATNWHPTFDPDIYEGRPKAVLQAPFVIGRHGRDGLEKWLEDPALLLKAYPSHDGFRVSILGGARKATEVLGSLPDAWEVIPFGERTPKDFLRGLDAFVYFPNTGLIEAFGRAIVEAMLAGVPVILPPRFESTFGSLPLYCEPDQVASLVRRLARDNVARVAWLTELQQIARDSFTSSSIAVRLAHTALARSLSACPKNTQCAVGPTLSAASQAYRDGLLDLRASGEAGQ